MTLNDAIPLKKNVTNEEWYESVILLLKSNDLFQRNLKKYRDIEIASHLTKENRC